MTSGHAQAIIDDNVSKRLSLKEGPNVIRPAVVNCGGAIDLVHESWTRTINRSRVLW
jgi:hypothetical protein